MRFISRRAVLAALAPFVVIACADVAPTPSGPVLTQSADHFPEGFTYRQHLHVCKVGTDAVFDVRIDGQAQAPLSVADGACQVAAAWPGGPDITVEVTERPIPGYSIDHTALQAWGGAPEIEIGDPVIDASGNPTVTATIGFDVGYVLTYVNVPASDPPTGGGGEGCTPGYWKQPHHYDSWTGYAPDQAFSDVFADAFPGMTLADVLGLGGGGLKALGRHAVAALLNASSSVSYDLTAADVISGFNAAFVGTDDDVEAQKDAFAEFNEQACPLN